MPYLGSIFYCPKMTEITLFSWFLVAKKLSVTGAGAGAVFTASVYTKEVGVRLMTKNTLHMSAS